MIRVLERLTDISHRREDVPVLRGLPSRYQVVRELGYGGMAVVYLARDKQLDRDVAIKVLHAALSADKASVARLSHEARLVAQLQHPNIVAIYDLERLRDKSVALIMQFVRGRTLRAVIDEQGRLSAAMTERVLSEIASALIAAHRRGIIHRDVKPENIYLDQESGRALLADFGIAQAPLIQSGLTLAGEAVGTPNYMSPEQIAGTDVDGRSDIYSLGLVGYEMLTGKQPWAGESLYNVLHKQQHENLPSLARLRPDAPAGLIRALEQAMRKDRAERPRSAEVLLKLLKEGGTGSADQPEPTTDTNDDRTAVEKPVTASPDAPTVRYRRPGAGYQEETDGDVAPAIPIQLFPWEANANTEEASETAPVVAPVKVSNPTFVGVKTTRLKSDQVVVGAKRASSPSKWRRAMGVIAASAAAACTVGIVGFFGMGVRPTAQAESLQRAPAAAEMAQEPTVVAEEPDQSVTRRSTPPPVRSSPSGSGSRRASEAYQARGDLSDVVCQPLGDETVEEWSRRVPAYCRR